MFRNLLHFTLAKVEKGCIKPNQCHRVGIPFHNLHAIFNHHINSIEVMNINFSEYKCKPSYVLG